MTPNETTARQSEQEPVDTIGILIRWLKDRGQLTYAEWVAALKEDNEKLSTERNEAGSRSYRNYSELQRQSAEINTLREAAAEKDDRIDWLTMQREIECKQKEDALNAVAEGLKTGDLLRQQIYTLTRERDTAYNCIADTEFERDKAIAERDEARAELKRHQEIHGHICLPTEVPESYASVREHRDSLAAQLEQERAKVRELEGKLSSVYSPDYTPDHTDSEL